MSTYEETGDPGQAYSPPARSGRSVGTREVLALIFLTVGSLLCSVLGWMVGIILLWTSAAWTSREKLIGTLVLPGGLAPAGVFFVFAGLFAASGCGSSSWTGPDGVVHSTKEVCQSGPVPVWLVWAVLAVLVVAPVITGIWLARAAYRRANAAA